ncbi:HTTM domain-containing protein [Bacillus subtilis]|nr:HTTM domain-containing protein [Bacillus subtilis]TYS07364.1 HTTM domain-containing protein [Bacillus subtilis]
MLLKKIMIVASDKKSLIGASILRIGFGLIILYTYAINYRQRYFIWGPNGMSQTDYSEQVRPFTLYSLGDSTVYFEIIFHLGILSAILFTVGYKTRIVTILNFIFLYSIDQQNPVILDGGDNIMSITLIYMFFIETNKYLSVDKMLKKEGKFSNNFYLSIIHNFGVLSIIVQLCILYLNSSLYKVMGELWQNGTAIYYILQVQEFNLPWISNIIISSDFLIVSSTYFTILLQVAFPFLLFNKVTKYIALALLITLHLGIAVVMGLITFSLTIIVIDAILISDKDYKNIYNYIKNKIKSPTKEEVIHPTSKTV